MPIAVVGLALVGSGAIAAATLGYVALGVTVAGMVTKNKTLLKIGGQLGLAAGVAGIATSFMGAGASSVGLGDIAKVAGGAESVLPGDGSMGSINNQSPVSSFTDSNPQTFSYDTGSSVQVSDINAPTPPPLESYTPSPPVNTQAFRAPDPTTGVQPLIGESLGTTNNYGGNIGQQDDYATLTANDTNKLPNASRIPGFGGSEITKPSSSFFDKDINKYAMIEGGKVVAGGIQGLATSKNANVQLTENRRVGDLQRSNMAQVGRGNYGLMRA